MQTLMKQRVEAGNNFKTFFNRRSVKFFMHLSAFLAVLYCFIDNSLVNEIRKVLNLLGIKDTNRLVFELGLPIQSLFQSVQFVHFLFLVFMLLIGLVVLPIVCMLFFKTERRTGKSKNLNESNLASKMPVIFGETYIINSRFLC